MSSDKPEGRRRGRPKGPSKKKIGIMMHEEALELLDAAAAYRGISRSEMIEELLAYADVEELLPNTTPLKQFGVTMTVVVDADDEETAKEVAQECLLPLLEEGVVSRVSIFAAQEVDDEFNDDELDGEGE